MQRLLKGFAQLQTHRGCRTTSLGSAFAQALQCSTRAAPHPPPPRFGTPGASSASRGEGLGGEDEGTCSVIDLDFGKPCTSSTNAAQLVQDVAFGGEWEPLPFASPPSRSPSPPHSSCTPRDGASHSDDATNFRVLAVAAAKRRVGVPPTRQPLYDSAV